MCTFACRRGEVSIGVVRRIDQSRGRGQVAQPCDLVEAVVLADFLLLHGAPRGQESRVPPIAQAVEVVGPKLIGIAERDRRGYRAAAIAAAAARRGKRTALVLQQAVERIVAALGNLVIVERFVKAAASSTCKGRS